MNDLNEVTIREKTKECVLSILGSNLCCCSDTKYSVMESFAQVSNNFIINRLKFLEVKLSDKHFFKKLWVL